MTALSGDRPFIERHHGDRNFPVAADVVIWNNAMVAIDATTGLAKPAGDAVLGAATDKVVGCAKIRADNRGGLASAISVEVKSDTTRPMYNSGGADTITLADVGEDCFVVDDQTVALTSDTNARARAGKIHQVTELGVWVRFDQ